MSAADELGIARLVLACVGLGVNLTCAVLMYRYRRRLRRLPPLTHFEQGSFSLSLRTGAIRGFEHLCGLALAVNLIANVPAVSWPSFVIMAMQAGILANDLQVLAVMRRNVRDLAG